MNKILSVCLIAYCALSTVYGFNTSPQLAQLDSQQTVPGKPVPDFTLNNIKYYKTKSASAKDFKGKWLFLTFWSTRCGTSIQQLQKMSAWQEDFKNESVWMMIGLNYARYKIRPDKFFEEIRVLKKINLPVAYDSVLATQWDIPAVPHMVIVDPSGIVRYLTDGRDITTDKLRKLFQGEEINLFDDMTRNPVFDPNNVSSKNPQLKNKLLRRSIIQQWNGEPSHGGMDIDSWVIDNEEYQNEGYNITGVPLAYLYNFAYRGKIYWDSSHPDYQDQYRLPILEMKDTSLFNYDTSGKGLFTYSLYLPPADRNPETIKKYMQHDLVTTFGFSATIERRMMTVWKLVAKPGALEKLKTKGGKATSEPENQLMGLVQRNLPSKYLMTTVSLFLAEKYQNPLIPFIDETGLKDNYDLTMRGDMSNLENVQKELKKKGLQLVLDKKEMTVLVIR